MILRRLEVVLALFFKFAHVTIQLLYGIWKVSALPHPVVSIFGSARMSGIPYAPQARELGRMLVEEGISVLTGGGPGLMRAALEGVVSSKKAIGKSLGIGVSDLDEPRQDSQVNYIELDYFFARKWLLTNYSIAFVVFPGGYGTLDELMEVLTLIQTKKLERIPIILVGSNYWKAFFGWFKEVLLEQGAIVQQDMELFTVIDDNAEIVQTIKKICENCKY